MDYQNALLSGPWMIYGHYLTVQPWPPSFRTLEHVINHVMRWIRLPKLPARYYHKSIIRSIGSVFGEVIRVDYNTDSGDRGKFSRLAVSIDLTKPLISKIQVDGEIIFVEYEGLPTICFHCGRYGHLQISCPRKMPVAPESSPAIANPSPTDVRDPIPTQPERDSINFGEWMVVQRKPRRTIGRADKKTAIAGGKIVASKSRYEVLNDVEILEEEKQGDHHHNRSNNQHKAEGIHQKKKGKDTRGAQKVVAGNKQKAPVVGTTTQDCIFDSPNYLAMQASTTLDRDQNSVLLIQDHRLTHKAQNNQLKAAGPTATKFQETIHNPPLEG
ncbi:hypothetical protein K1719_031409 [Acacia pycnantha]|nr:hypothetical protein K1719_031409 [Acacia pycnantha]